MNVTANTRSLIDFHLKRLGALVSLGDVHPVGDPMIAAMYEQAYIGAESWGLAGPEVEEEAASRVAAAVIVLSYGSEALS